MLKTLWFTNEARRDLLRLASQSLDGLEIGGLLFGFDNLDEGAGYAVVTHVTGPGPDSERKPLEFYIGKQTAEEAWRRLSKGYRFILGDWHTHPYLPCEPSPQDERVSLASRERDGWDRWKPGIVVIAAGARTAPDTVGAWFYTQTERLTLEIRTLDPDWICPVGDDGELIENTTTRAPAIERGAPSL
jgi:proteasome lid subunit RPN8/RPN11